MPNAARIGHELTEQNRTEQNIYFIDLNSTVSRHTYFDITKDFYKVTINVYMDLTTKL